MPSVTNCGFPLKQKTAICDPEGYRLMDTELVTFPLKPGKVNAGNSIAFWSLRRANSLFAITHGHKRSLRYQPKWETDRCGTILWPLFYNSCHHSLASWPGHNHTERFAKIVPMPLREQSVGTFHHVLMPKWNHKRWFSPQKYRLPLPDFGKGSFTSRVLGEDGFLPKITHPVSSYDKHIKSVRTRSYNNDKRWTPQLALASASFITE